MSPEVVEKFERLWKVREDDASEENLLVKDNDVLVKEAAEQLVQAILETQSGLIPGPPFNPPKLTNIFPLMVVLAGTLGLELTTLFFFLAKEMLPLYGEGLISVETPDMDIETMACDILHETIEMLRRILEDDKSHYLCGGSLSV